MAAQIGQVPNAVLRNKILLIIGSGPEQKNMQRLVQEWGLARHVKFVSYLSNDKVKQLYKKARCLMLGSYATPLWQEQFGFVLAEAITQTCPVIAATSGAIPEVVERAGILVQPSQPVDMYRALQQLDNEVYFQELKKVCGVLKSKFDAAAFRNSLVEVYRSLVE
jgi:glycosyltransferase involved in cell wall biosynthesis